MSKISLTNLVNLQNETTAVNAINANNTTLSSAIDNTISRDGTAPNQMLANLDMNSNQILNLPTPSSQFSPLRLIDAQTLSSGGTITVSPLPVGGNTGQILTKNSSSNYDVSWQDGASVGTVTNTNALRALTGGVKSVIEVEGSTTVGDGGGGTYYWNSTSTATDDGILVITPNAGGTGRWVLKPYIYSTASSVKRSPTLKMRDRADLRDWGVKADGVTDDTAAIQNAFNECSLYETLYGPSTPMLVSANGSQCLFLSRSINLENMTFYVANSLSSSVDILAIKPTTGTWYNNTFRNITIGGANGRFGRYAIHTYHDSTTQTMYNTNFERLCIQQGQATVGKAFYIDNVSGTGQDIQGGLVSSRIKDSFIAGGMLLAQVGDRITVENNQMLGTTTGGSLIDIDFYTGALNFQFIHNNCGQVSLYFRSGLNPYVAYNTFEQSINGYQPNNTVVDFDGVNAQIWGPVVENNAFQMLNAVSPSAFVRFNNCREPKLKGGNRMTTATAISPVVVTSGASNTFVSKNQEISINSANFVSGNQYVTSHEKPIKYRVNSLDADLNVDPFDHTIAQSGAITANRAYNLPDLATCFPGEQFIFMDGANFVGATNSIVATRTGTNQFQNGGTSYSLGNNPGGKLIIIADPARGIWNATKSI